MKQNRWSIIGLLVVVLGGVAVIMWILSKILVDQTNIPLIIAAVSSLIGTAGVIASLLVVIEMRRDREAIYRPDIHADFRVEDGLFVFFVSNDGQTSAKKVQVKINPIPIGFNNQPIDDVIWLHQPIETLLPGKKLEKAVDSHINLLNGGQPREFMISIKYQSLTGKIYNEGPYIINLDEYRHSTKSAPSVDYSLSGIADHLKKIAEKK